MPTATPFNNLITFSRGSNATVTGSNGLIQYAPNNLLTFSEQFDNAAWIAFSATASANVALAPDGTRTADKIAEVAGGAGQSRYATSTPPYITITASCYVKASERTFSRIAVSGGGSAQWFGATFDVQNGVVTQQNAGASGTVSGATITAVGDGWYRCTVTGLTGATSGNTFTYIGPSDSGTPTAGSFGVVAYTGTAGSGVFAWGAQLELGSTATTYNPTTVKNLLGFSEAFDNAAWAKTGSSVVTGAQANPVNGLFNAQKLMEDTSNGVHRVFATPACSSNTPYTYSVFVKAAGRTQIRLLETTLQGAIFDLVAGTVVSSDAGVTASIAAQGSGWYRCRITATTGAAQTLFVAQIQMVSGGLTSYTGDGNSGVYIYGAQLSDSASLDPYVPTPGAAPSSTAFYGPRFDFDPVTLQPRGLLVEEQRTNLALTSSFGTLAGSAGSQYPSGTGWANLFNTGGTRTYVSSAVFSGAQAMDIASVSAARNVIAFSFTPAASTTYAVSFYVESVSGVTGAVAYATGALGTGGTTNSVSAPTATGRYTYTFTTGTTPGTVDLRFGIGVAGNESGSIRISNVQVEAGAFATSYIPTVASTVTRSADVATISGSLFSQWYRQDEGAIAVEIQKLSPSATAAFAYEFVGATSNFSMRTRLGTDARMQSVDNGVTQVDTQLAASVPTTASKYAVAFRLNDYAGSANGATVATDTSGTVPAIATISIGSASVTNLYIRNIRFIPARAADFQLQGLST